MKTLWELFRSFFCIGLFTFGGGYAMLPMLQREVVDRHGWTTADELLDSYAIAQCTPGVIAVNTATYVGHKVKSTAGSPLPLLPWCSPLCSSSASLPWCCATLRITPP